MEFISVLIGVLYYYVINSARFHRWWSWLIMMCFNGVLCFFFAYWWIKEDFKDNLIGDCLLYLRNDSGDIADYYITDSSFWGFKSYQCHFVDCSVFSAFHAIEVGEC